MSTVSITVDWLEFTKALTNPVLQLSSPETHYVQQKNIFLLSIVSPEHSCLLAPEVQFSCPHKCLWRFLVDLHLSVWKGLRSPMDSVWNPPIPCKQIACYWIPQTSADAIFSQPDEFLKKWIIPEFVKIDIWRPLWFSRWLKTMAIQCFSTVWSSITPSCFLLMLSVMQVSNLLTALVSIFLTHKM